MAPLKALGSDGFHAFFFQSKWDIVGPIISDWVHGIFAGRDIDPELNNTLIVLIPKAENPESFAQLASALSFTNW